MTESLRSALATIAAAIGGLDDEDRMTFHGLIADFAKFRSDAPDEWILLGSDERYHIAGTIVRYLASAPALVRKSTSQHSREFGSDCCANCGAETGQPHRQSCQWTTTMRYGLAQAPDDAREGEE